MKFVPHYDLNTSLKHGVCATADDILARANLIRENKLICVGECFLPNKGYVPIYEGRDLNKEEQNLLCLIEYKEKDELGELINTYKEQYFRVNNSLPEIQRNGTYLEINEVTVLKCDLIRFIDNLKEKKSWIQ